MCKVSSKIRLCTCSTKDVYKLKHFWVLHRFKKGKNDMVVGQTVLPVDFSQTDHKVNLKTLLGLLNSNDIFDCEIKFYEKDLLHIAFSFRKDDLHFDYGFKYLNGKWKTVEYDSLVWMWHHEEIAYGKIKNAIETIK